MHTIPRVLRSMVMIPFATSAASLITRHLPNGPDIIEGEFTVIPPQARTKYLHIRFHFDELKHARNQDGISNRGGATLAYRRSTDRLNFEYAFALCNLKDNFSRYVGRHVAKGFLEDGQGWRVSTDMHSPDSRYIEEAMDKLTQKAMNEWMKSYPIEVVATLKKGFYQ